MIVKTGTLSDFLRAQSPHHHAAAVGCIKSILRQNNVSALEMVMSINEVINALDAVQEE